MNSKNNWDLTQIFKDEKDLIKIKMSYMKFLMKYKSFKVAFVTVQRVYINAILCMKRQMRYLKNYMRMECLHIIWIWQIKNQ